ncbi:hypothetical protein D8674_016657 [Pyrus ussuriensis x Pyrus communis]|uniref:Uncharacterized protein n=1 Tax=Pyrus ussuriensis x Pyrus communis TaxID=2448454 RepID=A0A5N5HDL3_9ROSA|nr:hypothetical protein D8674_016657 [Pyrus ussuriensis x Pyrus communis]
MEMEVLQMRLGCLWMQLRAAGWIGGGSRRSQPGHGGYGGKTKEVGWIRRRKGEGRKRRKYGGLAAGKREVEDE